MAFDPGKDKVLKQWRSEETGLIISINRYGEGEAKVQIGPRIFIKKDGGESQRRAGRITMEDLTWIYEMIDEIKDELANQVTPE